MYSRRFSRRGRVSRDLRRSFPSHANPGSDVRFNWSSLVSRLSLTYARRVMRKAILAVMLMLLVPAAAEAQAPEPRLGDCTPTGSSVRPTSVILTCGDAGLRAEGLSWSEWGQPRAFGDGTAVANTCDPDCATGGTESFPVTLVADRLTTCRDGTRRYTRATYGFPQASPFPSGSPGADDPTVVFPCPLPKPRLLSLRMRLVGVGPAGPTYYVRVTLRVRYCAASQRKVDLVVDERLRLGSQTFAERTRFYPRSHLTGGCRTRTIKYKLADDFFGVGTYLATVSVLDSRGQSSRALTRRNTTLD